MLFSHTRSAQPVSGSVGQVSDCTMGRRPRPQETRDTIDTDNWVLLLVSEWPLIAERESHESCPLRGSSSPRPREIQIPSDWPVVAG